MGHSEGKTVVKLTRDSLDISEGLAQVTAVDCGAVSMFLGTTRSDVIDGDIVSSLIYEAYDAMALKEMQKLCEEVRNTYSIKHIVLLHRLGRIPVKEASVMIVCSGRHRQDTLRSTEWLINKLKSRVPIWKREVFAGGSEAWKENKEAFWRQ
ncbi:molybdopterin synthase catalytic subunit-like [Varroa jacobsoni]|uniref:Molybdopterin synthase catalytic subunit n=1 Tax=Varroa destructor TaxID=109461 RepID=A0A7M7JBM0_VARDE|nr:molybdopterin synthase catalytic subunit-like [Varroa destructor]XP_022709677.1 molybdopterin synthase catalytic subunit-like [Varroa jacobsoni]